MNVTSCHYSSSVLLPLPVSSLWSFQRGPSLRAKWVPSSWQVRTPAKCIHEAHTDRGAGTSSWDERVITWRFSVTLESEALRLGSDSRTMSWGLLTAGGQLEGLASLVKGTYVSNTGPKVNMAHKEMNTTQDKMITREKIKTNVPYTGNPYWNALLCTYHCSLQCHGI